MSYPFAKAPTLREFLDIAITHGIIVAQSKATITGPDGESQLRYVQKTAGSAPIILTMEDDDRLTPLVISNLCRQLGLEPELFAMNLGGI